jgi:pimeloyl-ACP methyl ester carboxylesterase
MAVLLAALGGVMSFPAAGEAAVTKVCHDDDRSCVLLTVPLDRSGGVPGTVRLRVELSRAESPSRPPLFLLGGVPGQSATTLFGSWTEDAFEREVYDSDGSPRVVGGPVPAGTRLTRSRSRDMVVMDLRGTGRSVPLRCPELERAGFSGTTEAAAACAASLGPRRAFYTARDSAEDIEAVRQMLGVEKIALFGGSYGARVALSYARRHPDRVERLILDSPDPLGGPDALYRSSFSSVPSVMRSRCRKHACRRASKTPVADVAVLARRLARGPMKGTLIGPAGRRHDVRITSADLYETVAGTPLGAYREWRRIPGFLRNARRGDVAPLLRLRRDTRILDVFARWNRYFDYAAYTVATCEESDLPWPRYGPIEDRLAQAEALVQGLPVESFGPFGPRAALASDVLELCRKWPAASPAPDSSGPLPPVPTLVLAGEEDLRAPVAGAVEIARLIPGARLLTLPGVGHGTVMVEESGCAKRAVRSFLVGAAVAKCKSVGRPPRASRSPPLSLAEVAPATGHRGRVGRTVRAVNLTLGDGAQAVATEVIRRLVVWLLERRTRQASVLRPVRPAGLRAGGLRAGSYAVKSRRKRFSFRQASYVPGVRISGWLGASGRSKSVRGVIRVSGSAAARGRLVVRRGIMTGRLGGQNVRARIHVDSVVVWGLGATASTGPRPPSLSLLLSGLPR